MADSGNEALIRRFYEAFRALDADTMQASYCADADFDDPVFSLRGRDQIGSMWKMLCTAVKEKGQAEWQLDFSGIDCSATKGVAHWEPVYRFSATGRIVHNVIDASFHFRDGLISKHTDVFNFWRWSRQALGAPGLLLGWTPLLHNKVRSQANANLTKFRAKSSA